MNLRTIGDAFSTAPYIVKYHDMNREMLIARLTEVQQIVEQLLAQVQASEHDAFAAHLYGRGGNFDSRASERERAARQSSVA